MAGNVLLGRKTGTVRRVRALALGLVFAAACALGAAARDAGALSLHFEIANPNGANTFASYNYICEDCTVEQYTSMVLPAGYNKRNVRYLVPTTTGGFPATPPAGVAASLDFVLDIPGDDFFFCCEVLSGAFLGFDSGTGTIFSTVTVKRSNVFHYAAGSVMHDAIDPLGNRYGLFLIDVDLAETYDVEQLDGLAGIALPTGWTYESRVLDAPLALRSDGGLTYNVGSAQLGGTVFTAWQRYELSEPGAVGLAAAGGLAALGLGGRGRRAARPV
jgi:hypothetical protein